MQYPGDPDFSRRGFLALTGLLAAERLAHAPEPELAQAPSADDIDEQSIADLHAALARNRSPARS